MDTLATRCNQGEATTLWSLLTEGRILLERAGVDNAEREAVWLLEAALTTTHLALRIEPHRTVSPVERALALALFTRRANREPLQYLVGSQEFGGIDIEVTPSVLIPRPETELLLDEVVRFLAPGLPATVVDVGTGSGCLAVALAKALPKLSVYAVDCSEAALEVAGRNVDRHGLRDRVHCRQGDLFQPIKGSGLEGKVNVVLSNPPYISDTEWEGLQPEVRCFEPRLALMGGRDGMDVHQRLLEESWKFLVPGGLLVLEVGQGQAGAICERARRQGRYGTIRVRQDAAGIDRVVCAERIG